MADADDLNPGLEEMVEQAGKLATGKMSVGTFGTVLAYDPVAQKARVQPIIRVTRNQVAETQQLPPISNVPVTFPCGGAYSITWPLVAGDFVWLNFADRSLDEWLSVGGTDVNPKSKRRFSVTDAVALPAGRNFKEPLKLASSVDLVLGQDNYATPSTPISNPGGKAAPLQIRIGPTGIAIGDGGTTNDLLNIIDVLLTAIALESAIIPLSAAAAALVQPRLAKIKRP